MVFFFFLNVIIANNVKATFNELGSVSDSQPVGTYFLLTTILGGKYCFSVFTTVVQRDQ